MMTYLWVKSCFAVVLGTQWIISVKRLIASDFRHLKFFFSYFLIVLFVPWEIFYSSNVILDLLNRFYLAFYFSYSILVCFFFCWGLCWYNSQLTLLACCNIFMFFSYITSYSCFILWTFYSISTIIGCLCCCKLYVLWNPAYVIAIEEITKL